MRPDTQKDLVLGLMLHCCILKFLITRDPRFFILHWAPQVMWPVLALEQKYSKSSRAWIISQDTRAKSLALG